MAKYKLSGREKRTGLLKSWYFLTDYNSYVQINGSAINAWGRRLANEVSRYGNKQAMERVGESFRKKVNRYIPVGETGKMRDESYVLTTGKTKNGPWFALEYHNTPELPYVMYQYKGEIWGPNYPKLQALTLPMMGIVGYKHVGWTSPLHKHNTHRKLGLKRAPFEFMGATVQVTGYRKRGKHAGWIQYFKSTRDYENWKEGTASKIMQEVVERLSKKQDEDGQE